MSSLLFLYLSLRHTLLCSSLSKQHVCREFRRMHLVTRMSHTSSGLHASPSGWMNERAERLAGGGARWLRRRGLCQLLNVIKKVSVCWSQGLRCAHRLKMWLSLGGCVTGGFDQAESPPSKSNCLEISGPALTPQVSHSAKVLWPWEGSPGPRLWRGTRLHLQCEKYVCLTEGNLYGGMKRL